MLTTLSVKLVGKRQTNIVMGYVTPVELGNIRRDILIEIIEGQVVEELTVLGIW
jgi:hypothetical protein